MPSPNVVETARLTLRPPTGADRDVWVRLHRDPRTSWHAPHAMSQTDDDAVAFLDRTLVHWHEQGFGFWMAQDKATREVVGVCGLKDIDGAFLNLYYRLVFVGRGHGLGREMSRASAAHALEFLPALPVRALVKEVNTPSVRTALGTGFERVGTRVLHDDLPDEAPSTVSAVAHTDRGSNTSASGTPNARRRRASPRRSGPSGTATTTPWPDDQRAVQDRTHPPARSVAHRRRGRVPHR